MNFADTSGFGASHSAQQDTLILLGLQSHQSKSNIPAMPELPICPNNYEGTCERSSVYVSKETDTAFVITCRTCGGINVWPKKNEEGKGRYEAFLKHQAAREAQHRYESSRPEYSLPSDRRK